VGGASGGELGVVERLLPDGVGEAGGEFGGGICVAEEDVGDGVPTLNAWKPCLDYGGDMGGGPGNGAGAAGEEDEDDGLAGGGDGFE